MYSLCVGNDYIFLEAQASFYSFPSDTLYVRITRKVNDKTLLMRLTSVRIKVFYNFTPDNLCAWISKIIIIQACH